MHATKEAILSNEHHPYIKSFIFYTDLRAVGKQFQEYIERAKTNYNVSYIRSRPGKIVEDERTKNLIIWYEETVSRKIKQIEVDMVILCQALTPSKSNQKIGKILNIKLDEHGFIDIPDRLNYPVDTSISGVFACGYCQAPQDIPNSVVQAEAVSARVAESAGVKI
jgi:heterodisulfide reductase subunit A